MKASAGGVIFSLPSPSCRQAHAVAFARPPHVRHRALDQLSGGSSLMTSICTAGLTVLAMLAIRLVSRF